MYMYTNIKTLGVMCVRLSALGGVPRGALSGHWPTKAPPGGRGRQGRGPGGAPGGMLSGVRLSPPAPTT